MNELFFLIQIGLSSIALASGLIMLFRWKFKSSVKIVSLRFRFFERTHSIWKRFAEITVKEIPSWNSDLDDYNQLSLEAYKLIFEQAKERFGQSIAESETITKRSYILLSLYVATLSALVGFYFTKPEAEAVSKGVLIIVLSSLAICLSIYSFIMLFQLIAPRAVVLPGSPPAEILYKEAFQNDDSTATENIVYYNEICRYQSRIEYMKEYNEIRIRRFNYVLRVSLLIVLSTISVLLGQFK